MTTELHENSVVYNMMDEMLTAGANDINDQMAKIGDCPSEEEILAKYNKREEMLEEAEVLGVQRQELYDFLENAGDEVSTEEREKKCYQIGQLMARRMKLLVNAVTEETIYKAMNELVAEANANESM